jgi:uncharacterized membrane protein
MRSDREAQPATGPVGEDLIPVPAPAREPDTGEPTAAVTAGEAPTGEAPTGEAPTGEAPTCEAPGPGAGAAATRPRPDPVAWVIALLAFAAYLIISLSKYFQLAPGSWDLGIYTEYVKQIAHLHAPVVPIRGPGFNLLGDHFQPIVGLLAPFFRLVPSPVTLLVAQALLTAVSVLPVCQAARALLGRRVSWAVGAAYAFSWGLQQMIAFDFHEIAFAIPLLAFSLAALARRRLVPAVAWALPLVFVKEDQGFTVAAIGLVMGGTAAVARLRAARGRDTAGVEPARWAWAAALLAVWGLGWSVFEIAVIIPHFNAAHQYPYWDKGGVIGPHSHPALSAVAHQLAVSGHEKLWTTYLVLLPTAFLALRSPLVLIAAPSLLLRFLSTNDYYWGTGWHYSATLMPIVFLAAVDGMARIHGRSAARRRLRRWLPRPGTLVPGLGALAMLALGAWFAFRFPLDQLWNSQTYQISPHVRAEQAAMAKVPPGTTVEATLSMLAPLATRDETYWVGLGGSNPAPRYIVFDQTNSGWSPPPSNVLSFVESLNHGATYQQIFGSDSVYAFRLTGQSSS